MSIFHKAICRFKAIPIKIPMIFLIEIEKNAKIHMEPQKILKIVKAVLSKKNKARSIMLADFHINFYLKIWHNVFWVKTPLPTVRSRRLLTS
jgi:hypothetical protein